MAVYVRAHAAERVAHDEAVRVVERWNAALSAGRGTLWSPTIRAAVIAGMPWLDVYCPGCRTSRAIDRYWIAVLELDAGGAYQPRALPEVEIGEHLQAVENAEAALLQWRDEMQSGQAAEGTPRPPTAPTSTSA
jgi:hypothetical protein